MAGEQVVEHVAMSDSCGRSPVLSPGRAGRIGMLAAAILGAATFAWMTCWAVPASAQSASASYQIPRQSIDAGAGGMASASYTLRGSIGQPDAGAAMNSAGHSLRGGFHLAVPGAPRPDRVFANGFEAP